MRRRVFHHAFCKGEVFHFFDLRRTASGTICAHGRHCDDQLFAGLRPAGGKTASHGHPLPGAGKGCHLVRISTGDSGARRQHQRQAGFFGNTDIGTNQPANVGQQGHGACRQSRGRRNQDRIKHLIVIAKIHQRPVGDPLRIGPLDVAGTKPGRQVPVDARGCTRVAGITPVSMPARPNLLAQHHPEGFTCCYAPHLTDQAGRNIGRNIGRDMCRRAG